MNKNRTTIYVGVTNDIEVRVYQHKFEKGSQFTNVYNLYHLVFYEFFESIEEAIEFEKIIKNRSRAWKMKLIKKDNPDLIDFAEKWYDE